MSRHLPLLTVVLVLVPILAACGNGAADTSMPPLTPEPGLTVVPTTGQTARSTTGQTARPTVGQPGAAARLVLQRFLHGVGAGDVRVCALLTLAYARTLFGQAGCRAWVGKMRLHLTAEQLDALRTVQVPTGTAGPGADFTVGFDQLAWAGTALTAGPESAGAGPLRAQFVLRKIGSRWLLTA